MSFQYIIDNAAELSIQKRQKVAQTISRAGVVKTTSLGGQVYEIRARLPTGPRWSEERRFIEAAEGLDRTTVGTIKINNPGQQYIIGYQGDVPNPSITVSPTQVPKRLSITGGVTINDGFVFRAGDYIQLGANGSVYTVIEDVFHTNQLVTVHRPVRESAGTYTLLVGQDVSWDVICINIPQWTLFGFDQIRWNGEFVFVEAL